MATLDVVLSDFVADVDRAEHLLTLVKGFKEFGRSSKPSTGEDGADAWPAATVLHGMAASRRTDLPVLSGSLQLYLAGRFEYCIRQVVEAVADEICTRVSKFSDLPKAIQVELKSRTLEVVKSPKKYGYEDLEADALLATLVSSRAAVSAPIVISSRVLSITDSNMKDRVLSDVLARVGITDFWSSVGKQASFKLELEKMSDSEATREAQSKLNTLMEERNQVAHPTGSTNFPDPDQVLKTARFLKLLASTTVDLSKIYLATFPSPVPVPVVVN